MKQASHWENPAAGSLVLLLNPGCFHHRSGIKAVLVAHGHNSLLDLGPLIFPDMLNERGGAALGKTHAVFVAELSVQLIPYPANGQVGQASHVPDGPVDAGAVSPSHDFAGEDFVLLLQGSNVTVLEVERLFGGFQQLLLGAVQSGPCILHVQLLLQLQVGQTLFLRGLVEDVQELSPDFLGDLTALEQHADTKDSSLRKQEDAAVGNGQGDAIAQVVLHPAAEAFGRCILQLPIFYVRWGIFFCSI